MKTQQLLAATAGLCAALSATAQAQSFSYPDFSSTAGITQVLTTATIGNILRIHETGAPVSQDNMGAVWYSTPVSVVGGFDTTFQFKITGSGSGDGMAFVIQNDVTPGYNGQIGNMAIGRHAAACGYGIFPTSLPGESIENSLVVEIDHFTNANAPAAAPILDPDDNHVSIHTGGAGENNQQESFSIGRAPSATLGTNLNGGAVQTMRVVYVPGTLEVYLNGNLIITTAYDFNTGGTWIDSGTPVGGLNLIGGTSAYVGFTASSGGSSQAHDLISWSFDAGGSMGTSYCDPANNNSTGAPAVLAGSTNPGVGSGLHLEMTGGPVGEVGYLLVGTGANPTPTIMLGNGMLCLDIAGGNVLGRYNVAGTTANSIGLFDAAGIMQNLSGNSTVGSGFDVPATVPIPLTPTIMSGDTWHFQGWYRDTPAGVGQSNSSNGLSVTF